MCVIVLYTRSACCENLPCGIGRVASAHAVSLVSPLCRLFWEVTIDRTFFETPVSDTLTHTIIRICDVIPRW